MIALTRSRLLAVLAIALGLGIFAAANAHLLHVAISSQPECVKHVKVPGQDGRYRAARPSC